MATGRLREVVADYSPEHQAPLRGYATLMGAFVSFGGAFSVWLRRSGRELEPRHAIVGERDTTAGRQGDSVLPLKAKGSG